MKRTRMFVVAAAMCIASGLGAQPATYDEGSGVLTIPSVAVGTTTYGGVKLQHTGNWQFSLRDARAQPAVTGAEGIWRGVFVDGLMTWIQLDNGLFYIFEASTDTPNVIEILVHGSATSGNGTFFVPSLTAFDFYEPLVMTVGPITGKYQARRWIAFSAQDPETGQDVYVGGHFDTTYDAVPSLAAIEGNYSGEARFGPPFGAHALSATVHSNNSVTGNFGTCAFAGTITPRPRGNLYDITVPFGAGCDFSGQTFSGIVFLDPLTQRLMVATLNAQRTAAGMFIATR